MELEQPVANRSEHRSLHPHEQTPEAEADDNRANHYFLLTLGNNQNSRDGALMIRPAYSPEFFSNNPPLRAGGLNSQIPLPGQCQPKMLPHGLCAAEPWGSLPYFSPYGWTKHASPVFLLQPYAAVGSSGHP